MRLVPHKTQWLHRDPVFDFVNLQREINDLFSAFSGWPERRPGLLEGDWSPAIDVYESKDAILVKADLTGVKKEDVEISIHEGTLVIKGEKRRESETREQDFIKTERFSGSFNRAIALATPVDETRAKAVYKDGVLELTLPKREEAKPKQITISVS